MVVFAPISQSSPISTGQTCGTRMRLPSARGGEAEAGRADHDAVLQHHALAEPRALAQAARPSGSRSPRRSPRRDTPSRVDGCARARRCARPAPITASAPIRDAGPELRVGRDHRARVHAGRGRGSRVEQVDRAREVGVGRGRAQARPAERVEVRPAAGTRRRARPRTRAWYFGPVTNASSRGTRVLEAREPVERDALRRPRAEATARPRAPRASSRAQLPSSLPSGERYRSPSARFTSPRSSRCTGYQSSSRLSAQPRQHHRLHVAVALQPELSVHAADAALLHAAERALGDAVGDDAVVDDHAAGRDPIREPLALPRVARPHAGLQPVARLVRELERRLFVRAPPGWEDRGRRSRRA